MNRLGRSPKERETVDVFGEGMHEGEHVGVHNIAFCFRFLSRFSVRKLGSVPKHYVLGLQSSP
jgi:hypothetical protein